MNALPAATHPRQRRSALIVGILGNVLVLMAYKYTGSFLENLKTITGISVSFTVKTSPVGLSFYTFTVLSYIIVLLGWVLFFSGTLTNALHYYGQMFGAGHLGLLDTTAKYYLSNSWLLLLAGIVGSGKLPQRLHRQFTYRIGKGCVFVSAVLYAILFLISIAVLVSSTYTSFLYVQF